MNTIIYSVVKIITTAVIIFLISEIAKRYSLFAGIIASLPLTSLLAMIWLYIDTKDLSLISDLSKEIFYMVIPSLAFFICLPIFISKTKNFLLSMIMSSLLTTGAYYLWFFIIKKINLVK
ncbi:MAG: DUF3147 family protein [Kosmotoga sp.]|nr:MAG: DUF3147 family protein [Kosmotoga sp.]